MNKKIILLHYTAPPVVGGVESVMGHQARLMNAAGHQVQIVAGRGEQVDAGVPFVSVPLLDSQHPDVQALQSELNRGRVPPAFAQVVYQMVHALEQITTGTDSLIAHNVCSLNKNLALTAALRRISDSGNKPRLILWHHDLAWTAPRYRDQLHEGHPWDLLRTAWPKADQVTISEFRREELATLLRIPLDAIRVIPNGLDAARFFKLEQPTEQFARKLGLMNAWPLLLTPVRITSRKNLELGLQVLAALREKYPRAMLVVTGPLGPHNPANKDYFARLQQLRKELKLEGSAHFLAEHTSGFLPDEVISDFYRLADILFLPSSEEGFGIPVLEAGLSAMPVFCTDIPPLRELGGPNANYFSLDKHPAAIAGLIVEHLASSPVLGLRGLVRAGYTWDQIYQKHIHPLLNTSEGS
jgi:mannosylglucosylglycerate synthase